MLFAFIVKNSIYVYFSPRQLTERPYCYRDALQIIHLYMYTHDIHIDIHVHRCTDALMSNEIAVNMYGYRDASIWL